MTKTDYYEIITKEALEQIIPTEDEEIKFKRAEDSAEMSIIEYLNENYEIERTIEMGKRIMEYDSRINYPIGAYFEIDGVIHKAIRAISGRKPPETKVYWSEMTELTSDQVSDPTRFFRRYSQLSDYYPGDMVVYNGGFYVCENHNGYGFGDIRFPGVVCWEEAIAEEWQPKPYFSYDLVAYKDRFYTLYNIDENYDETITPDRLTSCWGEIADYDSEYNSYETSIHEYVVYEGRVFHPIINVNSDEIKLNVNAVIEDPRNRNVRKHMVRLALYELVKNITPNNISVIRKDDYEESMLWLDKANKMKINPGIPRKLEKDGKPNSDWGVATFQRSYDPRKNPWQV